MAGTGPAMTWRGDAKCASARQAGRRDCPYPGFKVAYGRTTDMGTGSRLSGCAAYDPDRTLPGAGDCVAGLIQPSRAPRRKPTLLLGKDGTLGPCYSPSIGGFLARKGHMSIRLRRREFI